MHTAIVAGTRVEILVGAMEGDHPAAERGGIEHGA